MRLFLEAAVCVSTAILCLSTVNPEVFDIRPTRCADGYLNDACALSCLRASVLPWSEATTLPGRHPSDALLQWLSNKPRPGESAFERLPRGNRIPGWHDELHECVEHLPAYLNTPDCVQPQEPPKEWRRRSGDDAILVQRLPFGSPAPQF